MTLSDFKSCLLAALRSTQPQVWTPKHEEAWTWLWDNLVKSVKHVMEPWAAFKSDHHLSSMRLFTED